MLQPTPTPELLSSAQTAYSRYGDAAGWKNYAGRPMPTWDDLPENTRLYWCAAISPLAFARFQVASLAQQIRFLRDKPELPDTLKPLLVSALESVSLPQGAQK